MHDALIIGIPTFTVLLTALINNTRLSGVETKLDLIQRDKREFYATQRVHDSRLDNLERHGGKSQA